MVAMNHREAFVSCLVNDRRIVGAVLLGLGHEARAQRMAREWQCREARFLRDTLDGARNREISEALSPSFS
jgi:hypothetical protein